MTDMNQTLGGRRGKDDRQKKYIGPVAARDGIFGHRFNRRLESFAPCTVKRVDEVVRHPHLVTQDQFTQVSKKVSDIPEENFTINIELFRHFSQVWMITFPT